MLTKRSRQPLLVNALLALAACLPEAFAHPSSVSRVVQLLADLREQVEEDGQAEMQSYDRYACWCEKTLERKAEDIRVGREAIAELTSSILMLTAEVAAKQVTNKRLRQEAAANEKSQREATAIRDEERASYSKERKLSERCIAALEAAIRTLTGAGTGGRGFIQTPKKTNLRTITINLAQLLGEPRTKSFISAEDLNVLRRFTRKLDLFLAKSADASSLAQMDGNPFGNYAPQSSQIQGVLKGMYEAFMLELEKANGEEARRQQAFESLMVTKTATLTALHASLEAGILDEAQRSTSLNEDKSMRDDAQRQLDADKEFFDSLTSGCQAKARDWAERSRLRSEELQGIGRALQIISSGASTISKASSTFVQFSLHTGHMLSRGRGVTLHRGNMILQGFGEAPSMRRGFSSKEGGYFDHVMGHIDRLIGVLRDEDADDAVRRDQCKTQQHETLMTQGELQHGLERARSALQRMAGERTRLVGELTALRQTGEQTQWRLTEVRQLRAQAVEDFKDDVREDMNAIKLLNDAIESLKDFSKNHGLELLQPEREKEKDVLTNEAKQVPKTWNGTYGGRAFETHGIVAILTVMKEDLEMDIKAATRDDAEAQDEHEKQVEALQRALQAQRSSAVAIERRLAELQGLSAENEATRAQRSSELAAEQAHEQAVISECAAVVNQFGTRSAKRKADMAGLLDLKAYLAGMDTGDIVVG